MPGGAVFVVSCPRSTRLAELKAAELPALRKRTDAFL
jgi:hypothetical protein